MPCDFDLIADACVLLNNQRISKMYFAFRKEKGIACLGSCIFLTWLPKHCLAVRLILLNDMPKLFTTTVG